MERERKDGNNEVKKKQVRQGKQKRWTREERQKTEVRNEQTSFKGIKRRGVVGLLCSWSLTYHSLKTQQRRKSGNEVS